MDDKKKILFLCTHNAARSQMAEGFVNALYRDRYEAFSAGSEPTEVHPCAIDVMAEEGIDIALQRAKPLDEYLDASFDYVVTMCADAQESCPIFPGAIFPGGIKYIHHAFDDPLSDAGPEGARCASFRRVRDEVREWIGVTFGSR
ncbi:MAG: arsenate reductase ArsC [Halobacteriota archaeon]